MTEEKERTRWKVLELSKGRAVVKFATHDEHKQYVSVTHSYLWDGLSEQSEAYLMLKGVHSSIGLPLVKESLENGTLQRSRTITITEDMVLGVRNIITKEQKKFKNLLATMAREEPEELKRILAEAAAKIESAA